MYIHLEMMKDYVHMCSYVYIHIYIYIHADKKRERTDFKELTFWSKGHLEVQG